ncbi:hypothetical protein [Streptomyces sp. Mg1]|uniref:hypothetical protein n=1 Tax=Streptomyces sp. Mg1 TaxID=465541 RepID=UPI00064D2584|nr:hypothetical protein [Streptomyces sp. Mg1]AKL71084.1 hypothetical protein M444_37510 [Streptomyces sp. Mg1]
MNAELGESKREFVGFIRIVGQPDIQLRLMATSSGEARAIAIEQYGEGHVISIWNEEDARRPR